MVLSTLVLALSASLTGEAEFLAWGWRIPFLLSIVLLAIGLFVRARVAETPVFAEAARAKPTRSPLMEVLRHHPRNLLLSIGVGFGAFVAQATITTFVISYAVQGGFPRATVLNALTVSSAVAVFGIVAFSALSDRLGRRPVVLAGAVGMAIWAFAAVPADRQQVHGAARRRRRRRPGPGAHGVVRAAGRALHRAVLHRCPLHGGVAGLPDGRAWVRASPPSRSPR